jgi:hypothetical protein
MPDNLDQSRGAKNAARALICAARRFLERSRMSDNSHTDEWRDLSDATTEAGNAFARLSREPHRHLT